MAYLQNFTPSDHNTVTLACTTSNGARQFSTTTGQYQSIRLYNQGPDLVYVRLGASSPTASVPNGATVGDFPIPVGDIEVFLVENNLYIAGICPTSTATLVITPGRGQ